MLTRKCGYGALLGMGENTEEKATNKENVSTTHDQRRLIKRRKKEGLR